MRRAEKWNVAFAMSDLRDGGGMIVSLTGGDSATAERAGPKAANLAKLYEAGLPVPEGFCLAADAYRAQIASAGVEDATSRVPLRGH